MAYRGGLHSIMGQWREVKRRSTSGQLRLVHRTRRRWVLPAQDARSPTIVRSVSHQTVLLCLCITSIRQRLTRDPRNDCPEKIISSATSRRSSHTMLIRRSQERHGNIFPAAFNALAAIPDQLTFHTDHQRRHPKSAYATSLRLIAEQWVRALDALDHLHTEHNFQDKESGAPALLSEYAELLFRLNEHPDACFSALRSLCASTATKPTDFDTQVLAKSKLPGWKQFQAAVRPYRQEHIGLIVNTLKHRQGELCSVHFKSLIEFRPGYFLRDVLPDGSLGPSATLHSNGNTAFSFARDMMLHLWWLFRIGELLAEAVRTALLVNHAHTLVAAPVEPGDTKWAEVVRRCGELKPEFFPDEIVKPYPRILFQPSPSQVILEFPTSARGHKLLGTMTVVTALKVDMAHPSNKMPYMAQKQ